MPVLNRLSVGVNYEMEITSILEPKKFTKSAYPGIDFFSYRIYFKDKAGKEYQGEYVIPKHNQELFNKFFSAGDIIKFHVTNTQGIVDEIAPGHIDAAVTNRQGIVANASPILPAGGQTYTFAMGWAKDIFCARIAAGNIPDPDNIESMLIMAKEINAAMKEMQREQMTNHQ